MKLKLFAFVILTAALSACGWQLRGRDAGQFPAQIQLVSPDRYAPLVMAVARGMLTRHIESTDTASLRLELDLERLSKRTVAVSSIGAAAQYELTLSAPWRLYSKQGDTIAPLRDGVASSVRVFDFQPGNNLGKTEEENTLMAEMRREIASAILQQTQTQVAP